MSETHTSSGADDTVSAYATLRLCGDQLDPERVTAALGVEPTLAYRKGEVYRKSRTGQETRGRTGVWLLSTHRTPVGHELADHLRFLVNVLTPEAREAVRTVMRQDGLEADASCFWHGKAGAKPPSVPGDVAAVFAELPAAIETDFDTD